MHAISQYAAAVSHDLLLHHIEPNIGRAYVAQLYIESSQFHCFFTQLTNSDGTQVPDPGLKSGFFPFERVRFFSLKTRVPGFPIFKILRPKNVQISTILVESLQNSSIFW